MGLFKDVTQTVKNIFNADDDMMFDDENDFKDRSTTEQTFSKMPFANKKKDNKVYPMNGGKIPSFDLNAHSYDMAQGGMVRKGRSNGKIQVYVPKSFEEAFNIIKDVKAGFTAMVNVEVANPQVSQRIVDVISGAIYALDGECKKMGEKQYIFSLSAETIGAYDYLPTSGVPVSPVNNQGQMQNQNVGFNFNMNQPFEFLNQPQQQAQPMQQQNFNQMNFNEQSFSPNNQNPMANSNNTDFSKFYQQPKSQF